MGADVYRYARSADATRRLVVGAAIREDPYLA